MGKRFGERRLESLLEASLSTKIGIKDAYVQLLRHINGGCFNNHEAALERLRTKAFSRSHLDRDDLDVLLEEAKLEAQQQPPISPPTFNFVGAFDAEPQPIQWLFHCLMPRGSNTLVHADPKIGKSWWAFYLAICLADEREVLGKFKPNENGKTLILSPEGGLGAVRRRLWGLAEGMGVDRARLQDKVYIVDKPGIRLDNERDYDLLLNTVDRIQPSLVVIDPIIEFHDADENAAKEVSKLLGLVTGLRETKPDLCCMITHHNARGSRHARGSTAFQGWYDVRVSLSKQKSHLEWNDPITAAFCCRDGEPPKTTRFRLGKPPIDTWQSQHYEPIYLDVVEADETLEEELERRAVEVLANTEPYILTQTLLRNSLQKGGNDIRSAVIKRMISEGTVHRDNTGKLALADDLVDAEREADFDEVA